MEKYYSDKLGKIEGHAIKLAAYLHVLKTYAETEMLNNQQIGYMLEILESAVEEIENIANNCC